MGNTVEKLKGGSKREYQKLAVRVGERIREIRKQENLSLEALALRCDMNPAYVGHIERGIRNPTLYTLDRICNGLGISIEDLFKDTPVNLNTAAMRHLEHTLDELTPEQTQKLLHIVDNVVNFDS